MEHDVIERPANADHDAAGEVPARVFDGAVKWYDPVKGFGFVIPDDAGPDIFLGKSIVDSAGLGIPAEGGRVKVAARQRPQGWSAVELLTLEAPTEGWEPNGQRTRDAMHCKQPPVTDLSGPRRGSIKKFNEVRGFGFVTLDDGSPDIFVHVTVLLRIGVRTLAPGEAVEVTFGKGPKGLMATEITLAR